MDKRVYIPLVLMFITWITAHSSGSISSVSMQHSFKYITIEEGLSINLVTTIHKDALGYIWFGTSSGLNKYDGYSVISYSFVEGDSTSLPNNGIFSMFLDSKERFWIGTSRGLCHYNYLTDQFVRYPFVYNNKILNPFIGAIAEDKEGNMWIGTEIGLYLMDIETMESEYFPLFDPDKPDNIRITSLCFESDSILNVGTHEKGFIRYSFSDKTYKQYFNVPDDKASLSENWIETIYLDFNGDIWIGTNNNGINKFDRETGSFKRVLVDPANERSKRVRSIVQDPQGNYWFGTRNGLYTKNGTDNAKFVRYAHSGHTISTLNSNSIYDIYIDNTGVMWLGTYAGGVNYTNLNRKRFYHFRSIQNNDLFLNNKIVQCFAEDNEGNLWIGTENGGLNVFNKKTGKYSYYKVSEKRNSLSANNIKCLAFDDNNGLWIGTYNGGLNYFDIAQNRFHHYMHQKNNENSISDNRVYSLLYDSNKDIWVGTGKGVCRIEGNTGKIHRYSLNRDDINIKEYSNLTNRLVDAIYEDYNGNIFVGILSYGLFQFQKKDSSFTRFDYNEYLHPTMIYQDSEHNLWTGTSTGLFLINDFEKSLYTHFTMQDGLPSNIIFGILEDEKHNLWLSTASGLVKYKNAVKNPYSADFVIYEQSDGLQSKQFFNGAALKSKDGQMFFGGVNGFNAFDPDSIKENKYRPAVYINEFLIFNQPVQVGIPGSPLKQVIELTKKIELTWRQSVFSFGFIALNYANPDKVKYAYKMEGFDIGWNYTSSDRRLATYTNLNPGKYVFRVKVSNNEGEWNKESTSVNVIISPPFWKTWLFKSAAIILSFLLLLFGIKLRVGILKKRSLELKHMVEQRTRQLETTNEELKTFSYSVSHDLRAPLRWIDGFSSILLDDQDNITEAQKQDYLQRIKSAVLRMTQLIDDMLILSRISRADMNIMDVNLGKIALMISNNLKETQPNRKVKFIINEKIIANADSGLIKIVMENLIGNAWKFTSKNPEATIEFGTFQQYGTNVFFVRDNGVGFNMNNAKKLFGAFQRFHSDKEFPGTGIGLATVQRVIHRHGGKIWAESETDKGAVFYFTLA